MRNSRIEIKMYIIILLAIVVISIATGETLAYFTSSKTSGISTLSFAKVGTVGSLNNVEYKECASIDAVELGVSSPVVNLVKITSSIAGNVRVKVG